MRFTDKPLSFSIDDILKSSNQSTHFSFPIMTKQSYSSGRLEHSSDQRLSSCHCHLSTLQLDTTYPNFIHHRRCRRTRTVFSGNLISYYLKKGVLLFFIRRSIKWS
jgi:hypothetical protein